MIGRLRGSIEDVSGSTLLIDVGGVGYEVSVPDSVALQMPPVGQMTTLWIRQVFREDGVTLFGFTDQHQRRVFDLLTEVKGCGPRIGLALLGQVGEETVIAAILGQDSKALIRASGVGAKLAERILLELKDKIQEEALRRKITASTTSADSKLSSQDDELIDALLALGYRRQEAEAVCSQSEPGNLEDRLRVALRMLAR